MITEDYVSYEVAKLLKEKGFNEKCRGCYHYIFDNNDNPIVMLEKWIAQPYNNDFEDETFICSAPTHQMAMKWLREVHNIFYVVYPKRTDNKIVWKIDICNLIIDSQRWYLKNEFDIYEEAVEAAIKYCLKKLIS